MLGQSTGLSSREAFATLAAEVDSRHRIDSDSLAVKNQDDAQRALAEADRLAAELQAGLFGAAARIVG
jgi:hypothetical protein